ncbi:bifunctional DNA-formamidopyrimidine glycosylase/DNA-(apurinic or apyrimidinic site) lyase [Phycisphaerales bacterium AB-hyl4]|uniref:Formamidopyrimidine-DNA glycosylase n=1 Tax=Natronomicrosphaera hydrolytica TaxID=3242702 RepID=A0ABV4U686_9BACT
MPELPEVENLRLTLERHLLGRTVARATLHRDDVLIGRRTPAALLQGKPITALVRHGKQLALITPGPCLCVHLGMSGSLRIETPTQTHDHHQNPLDHCATASAGQPLKHVHAHWQLDNGLKLLFRDPRRFGGLWTFPTPQALHASRWARLGDDALAITPARLHRQLQTTQRALKAVLLDQTVIAGLGNIYVDELLFNTRLAPQQPAHTLTRPQADSLVRHMRTLLRKAIAAGGSTLRDYVDSNGDVGSYQLRHRVYGRADQPCRRRACRGIVHTAIVAGRTTAWCPDCQPTTSDNPRATLPKEEKRNTSLPHSSSPGAL